MKEIEGIKELMEANFGFQQEEIEAIVKKLLKKYQNGPKTRNAAQSFRKEIRRELEKQDPKRVLFTIDK